MGDSVFFDRQISYLGDFTWNSVSGRSVRLKAVAVQSLSELERVRLQEVAYARLHQDYDLGCQITIPKDGQKRKKSLRRKLDSLAKEKNKDKECVPQAFAIPLSQAITNDRAQRQRQDSTAPRDDHRDTSDLVSSILQFATSKRPAAKELSSSNSSLSSTSETANESSPNTPEAAPRARRRGGMSVDSITDLDDNQSRLLEALQLSLPADAPSKKEKHRDKRLSLNPIYRQVPRVLHCCCQHMEKYGLQTVGIFRVGSSKKRVRQLREEFDRGVEVQLEEEHSVHDVAALLKEFLRDMPDPLLTKELYTAFINTMLLDAEDQQICTQLLVYLLPACNSDTLHRLLDFLSTVARHAHDTQDKDGQEVTGNKMTSLNLATIFGPNLLHKQKNSDKEFSVQSSARAEESTAVIGVVQRMIDSFDALFMVPPDLQNEVLMSLLETDPDVVDYLLRRKASQSPELLRSEASFSLSERRSSSDSNKASSGELSPYDNNSPVLCERRGTDGAVSGGWRGVAGRPVRSGSSGSRSSTPWWGRWPAGPERAAAAAACGPPPKVPMATCRRAVPAALRRASTGITSRGSVPRPTRRRVPRPRTPWPRAPAAAPTRPPAPPRTCRWAAAMPTSTSTTMPTSTSTTTTTTSTTWPSPSRPAGRTRARLRRATAGTRGRAAVPRSRLSRAPISRLAPGRRRRRGCRTPRGPRARCPPTPTGKTGRGTAGTSGSSCPRTTPTHCLRRWCEGTHTHIHTHTHTRSHTHRTVISLSLPH
ncbi:rho GTPase-activating protein 6-like isoform X2 [Sardina pilchardus]|uniref:rho GTPase-activating protein 6-like isoform X2 n=1 Tax=Sardina pilchardus TaxID=27697 RepID=UPI002E0D883A